MSNRNNFSHGRCGAVFSVYQVAAMERRQEYPFTAMKASEVFSFFGTLR